MAFLNHWANAFNFHVIKWNICSWGYRRGPASRGRVLGRSDHSSTLRFKVSADQMMGHHGAIKITVALRDPILLKRGELVYLAGRRIETPLANGSAQHLCRQHCARLLLNLGNCLSRLVVKRSTTEVPIRTISFEKLLGEAAIPSC